MPKRPPNAERVPLTDEWGIYDPAKAGMQALYARLGRPVLRASPKSVRQERRRGFRPERPADGVGLAIEEAMIRAGMMKARGQTEPPAVPVSPARALRIALKSTKTPKAATVPDILAPSAGTAPGRKASRQARAEADASVGPVAAAPPPVDVMAAAPSVVTEPVAKARVARRYAKANAKASVKAETAHPEEPQAPGPHVPPAPSPRRPRGPVPLAAWAHAVADAPRHEPRRADKRGFWRGIFRMPADVALVEYAHGCRIHRLLIETSDDAAPYDLL